MPSVPPPRTRPPEGRDDCCPECVDAPTKPRHTHPTDHGVCAHYTCDSCRWHWYTEWMDD